MGAALLAALAVLYPVAVYAGARVGATRAVAAAATLALVLRGAHLLRRAEAAARRRLLGGLAAAALPAVLALAVGDPRVLMALPVAVSLALLAAFAHSLRSAGPCMAESVARLQVSDLSPAEVRYCRRVTQVWCAFFAVNAALAAGLAAAGAVGAWALWTGLLAYVAMALLFAAERVVRRWRFRRDHGDWADRLLARLLPAPDASSEG